MGSAERLYVWLFVYVLAVYVHSWWSDVSILESDCQIRVQGRRTHEECTVVISPRWFWTRRLHLFGHVGYYCAEQSSTERREGEKKKELNGQYTIYVVFYLI